MGPWTPLLNQTPMRKIRVKKERRLFCLESCFLKNNKGNRDKIVISKPITIKAADLYTDEKGLYKSPPWSPQKPQEPRPRNKFRMLVWSPPASIIGKSFVDLAKYINCSFNGIHWAITKKNIKKVRIDKVDPKNLKSKTSSCLFLKLRKTWIRKSKPQIRIRGAK